MKKFITGLFAILAISAVTITSEPKADAQIVYGRICCDGYGNGRCVLDAWYPINSGCFCYGQGYGVVCR